MKAKDCNSLFIFSNHGSLSQIMRLVKTNHKKRFVVDRDNRAPKTLPDMADIRPTMKGLMNVQTDSVTFSFGIFHADKLENDTTTNYSLQNRSNSRRCKQSFLALSFHGDWKKWLILR